MPRTVNLKQVLAFVQSASSKERNRGLLLLGAGRQSNEVQTIRRFLHHKDISTRQSAIWSLGWIGSVESIPLLADVVEDSEWAVRRELANALGRVGGVDAIKPLARLSKDEHLEVRRESIIALGLTKSQGAIEPLVNGLTDSDRSVRQRALEALVELGWKP